MFLGVQYINEEQFCYEICFNLHESVSENIQSNDKTNYQHLKLAFGFIVYDL